ncbi:MAG TPA: hypothetical protein VJ783_26200 [Pirellulales bacterium]|nr:hypothetical protein [Pirellulales bacterium]
MKVCMNNWRGSGRALAFATAAAMASLVFGDELRAQGRANATTARGTIERMTTAPKGEIDGAVLDDGTWIHWPPHLEDRFTAAVDTGDRVEALGRMETGKKGDSRFEVRMLTNLDTNATVENDEPRGKRKKGRGGPPPEPRRFGPTETVRGTVERLTTAPKGETDGAILDDGTFIHWPPHLEDRFAAVVSRGDRIEAVGFHGRGKRGEERFEVESLTNLRTDKTAQRDDGPPRDRRRDDRGANRSRSEQIRQLKEEVERIEREIERLERDL